MTTADPTPPPPPAPARNAAAGGVGDNVADEAGDSRADEAGDNRADDAGDNRARDVAILAGALLRHALAAFAQIPDPARGPALEAIDRFLAAPGPASFVAAARELREARRRHLVETRGAGTLRRALDDGVQAVSEVPGLPEAIAARLAADLPLDALTGARLRALSSLARAYEELASRVAADTDEMRKRYKAAPIRRRPRGRNHL